MIVNDDLLLHTVELGSHASVFKGVWLEPGDEVFVLFQGKWRTVEIPSKELSMSFRDDNDSDEVVLKLNNYDAWKSDEMRFTR